MDAKSTCTRCFKTKSADQFYIDNNRSSGLTAMCINCINVHHRRHPLFAQYIKGTNELLHKGEVISEINTIEKAILYAKRNELTLDVVDKVKKRFND